jgi:hypothetical protein
VDSEYDEEEGGHQKIIVEKKPLAPATTNGNVCSEDVVDLVDCLVGGDEDCAARPIGQKKAKQLRDAAQRQIDIDEKAAQAMQSRAETHKLQLEFKVFSSMGDAEEAKEWKTLVAQQFLLDRKKVINNKKRAAEAEEERLKKKREQKERLQKEIAPHAIDFSTEKENVPPLKENAAPSNSDKEEEEEEEEEETPPERTFAAFVDSSSEKPKSCCASDFCFTLTMTKRRNRLLGTNVACARVFAT